jgi:ABC-type transporter MlaC component
MKTIYTALFVSAVALLAVGQSNAAPTAIKRVCGEAPAAPSVIDGKSATEQAMRQTAAAVRGYASKAVNYLTCVDNADISTAYLSQPSYRAAVAAHRDQIVDRLEMTVGSFNSELRAYKDQQSQVASK